MSLSPGKLPMTLINSCLYLKFGTERSNRPSVYTMFFLFADEFCLPCKFGRIFNIRLHHDFILGLCYRESKFIKSLVSKN